MGKTKKSKITRDRDRDISEKVALCTASSVGGAGRGGEDKGMDSGFATDDQYHVYDKALFSAQPTLSTLYSRPNKGVDVERYGNAEQLRMTGPRDGPLEFEEDYFGLGQFSSEVNTGKKALKEVGARGSMRASAGSSMRDGYEGGSSRTHIGFESGC
ncbi:snw/ski-interacting protein [Quercus suber]|uniref:Snw/ski-interacting protein n=1 Tax=Quercus suber TaxID=58331 RepID=A0AAW0LJW7_QUESU